MGIKRKPKFEESYVEATVTNGVWQGRRLKIIIGAGNADTHVLMDGKPFGEIVTDIVIGMHVGEMTTLSMRTVKIVEVPKRK